VNALDYSPALVLALAHRDQDTTRELLQLSEDRPALVLAAAILAAQTLTEEQVHHIAHCARITNLDGS
jgi:DNA-binding FadR family transcriptional regulator